jgi:hypothetical protein
MILIHASNHESFKPDYQELVSNITNHPNGALGLWCCPEHFKWMDKFGRHIHKFSFEGNFLDLSVEDLMSLGRGGKGLEDFIRFREEYLEQGIDGLKIIERTGESHMVVILNLDLLSRKT